MLFTVTNMVRVTSLVLTAISCLYLHLSTLPQASSAQGKSTKLPQAVVSTHDLMSLFNEPLFENLKTEMQSDPTDDTQWTKIADHANRAAELANLVAIREQKVDDDKWQRLSIEMQQSATKLASHAKAKDFAAAKNAYMSMVENCNACHTQMAGGKGPALTP